MAANVSRTREVAKPANWVVSAKIEFIRENGAEATQNQQFIVTAVITCCPHKPSDVRLDTNSFDKEILQSVAHQNIQLPEISPQRTMFECLIFYKVIRPRFMRNQFSIQKSVSNLRNPISKFYAE